MDNNILIENFSKIVDNLNYCPITFSKYSKMYLVTTENIDGYMSNLDMKGKNVLTVASSGDHMLSSYCYGAKTVDLFDINYLAYYQSCLKKASVMALDQLDFVSFYFGDNNKFLNKDIYLEIEKYLNDETKEFFRKAYSEYSSKNIYNNFYRDFKNSFYNMVMFIPYISKYNYDKTRDNLNNKKETFYNYSLLDLTDVIKDKKYDFIFLSNISDYLDIYDLYDIMPNLKNLLTDDGIIQVGYIYGMHDYSFEISDFSNGLKRRMLFLPKDYKEYRIPSYYNGYIDKVLIYKNGK